MMKLLFRISIVFSILFLGLGQFFVNAYADEKIAQAKEGVVVIECIFENSQKPKNCKVISEVPNDKGFGAYAVQMFMENGSLSQIDPNSKIEDDFEEFRVKGQFTFKFALEGDEEKPISTIIK